jgi:hypothetical protein
MTGIEQETGLTMGIEIAPHLVRTQERAKCARRRFDSPRQVVLACKSTAYEWHGDFAPEPSMSMRLLFQASAVKRCMELLDERHNDHECCEEKIRDGSRMALVNERNHGDPAAPRELRHRVTRGSVSMGRCALHTVRMGQAIVGQYH